MNSCRHLQNDHWVVHYLRLEVLLQILEESLSKFRRTCWFHIIVNLAASISLWKIPRKIWRKHTDTLLDFLPMHALSSMKQFHSRLEAKNGVLLWKTWASFHQANPLYVIFVLNKVLLVNRIAFSFTHLFCRECYQIFSLRKMPNEIQYAPL